MFHIASFFVSYLSRTMFLVATAGHKLHLIRRRGHILHPPGVMNELPELPLDVTLGGVRNMGVAKLSSEQGLSIGRH